eukprot:TRINITY_DN67475_c6_g2_i1.p1 TRINITY_DN67475_c6_g2~~TRINITY_DN67475_c6_g2_i1.p1  ORF type:complete len:335 (+),score=42.64 TRINITY_DN67475_c6_g2_i1:59-1063(+)
MGVIRPVALHGHTRALTRVKFNREGDLLFSCAKDTSPTVWDSETGERLGTYEGHQGAVWDLDVNFCSTLFATAGAEGHAKIWDLRTGDCVTTINIGVPVRSVGLSHGDSMLLCVTDNSYGKTPALRVYNLPGDCPGKIKDAKTEYNPYIYHENPEKITCAAWGPTNDTIYFSSEDGYMVIYNAKDDMEAKAAPVHRMEIRRFTFDRDYCTLLTGSMDQCGKLVDATTLKTMKTYETDKQVNDAVISNVSPHVVLGGGQDAQSVTNVSHRQNKFESRFFHKVYAEELGSVSTHFGPVNALSWHPGGRGFASGGEDGFVKMCFFDEEYLELYGEKW